MMAMLPMSSKAFTKALEHNSLTRCLRGTLMSRRNASDSDTPLAKGLSSHCPVMLGALTSGGGQFVTDTILRTGSFGAVPNGKRTEFHLTTGLLEISSIMTIVCSTCTQ